MSPVSGVARRRFLQWTAAAAGATAGAGALSACSGARGGGSASVAADGALLRVGAGDATGSTGLDPRDAGFGASYVALYHVYDSLMYLQGGRYVTGLARSVEPNADATEWTIRLHEHAVFHNGAPVRAADVAYSLRTLAAPPSKRASVFADLDPTRIKVVDATTLRVGLTRPRGDFRESVLVVFSPVFPEGTRDFAKGIGSGPYRLEENDGKNLRLVAHRGYWGGRPSFERIELVRIADPAARLNALKSGQIDYAMGISATGARAERANPGVRILRGGAANSNALSFAMNARLAPFDDPDVRRAVRLAADRDALVERVLMGWGTRGDDLVGKQLPGYATGAGPRQREVAEARRLFARAGVRELTLRAADTVPGFVTAARLFGQQLRDVGVELHVEQVPADTYYADLPGLTRAPFQTFYYTNRPAAVHLSATTAKGAFFNVTGLAEDHWKRLAAAQATVDDDRRAARFAAIQQGLYASGGDLLWGFQEQVDAAVPGLSGVAVSQSVPLFARATVRG
ncbi:ABC transporter substrate-binding protein [Streptomyces sp. RGM 3693]|uniref:ABC transporter substrate-binding protein n=1 Tax=Streptomyces sp. RGM 3693 TaxID=3413284 RepID=UPI003D2A1FCA